jgi:tetratricopeptide (TPR) repeat protein
MAELAEGDPAWQALGAGYFVLRVFDAWLDVGPARTAADLRYSNIPATIAALPEEYQSERHVLGGALQLLSYAPVTDPTLVVGPFLSYGAMLEDRCMWAAAADVYQTIAQGLDTFGSRIEPTSMAIARLQEGKCWRNAQRYEHSAAAYQSVAFLATSIKHHDLQLRARYGLANIARIRGNLSQAETALDELLEDAERYRPSVTDLVKSHILHSRGAVRQVRGRPREAMDDLSEAYRYTTDPLERDLILTDFGVCAGETGDRNTALHTLEAVIRTTRNTLARQISIVNLIEHAVLDENRDSFNRWCDNWSPRQCTAMVNAYGKLYFARGIELFKGRTLALSAFHETAKYAAETGIRRAELEALHEIERLE